MEGHWNLLRLQLEVFRDHDTTVRWCQAVGLLPSRRKCERHGLQMRMTTRFVHGFGSFRCTDSRCSVQRSLSVGTWFESCSIPIDTAITLTYCFTVGMSYEETGVESTLRLNDLSPHTISTRFQACRQVCANVIKQDTLQVGGDCLVYLHEARVGHGVTKGKKVRQGIWILALTDGRNTRYMPLSTHTMDQLMLVLNNVVVPGSTIVTECWKAYDVDKERFEQTLDKHGLSFMETPQAVDATGVPAVFQEMEKHLGKAGVRQEHIELHVCEFLWRQKVKEEKKDVFAAFVADIGKVYSLQSK